MSTGVPCIPEITLLLVYSRITLIPIKCTVYTAQTHAQVGARVECLIQKAIPM